jgi:hypothetical protein
MRFAHSHHAQRDRSRPASSPHLENLTLIRLSRCRPRQPRALFRRSILDLAPRGPAPPLILQTDPGAGLRVRFRHDALAVEQLVPGGPRTAEMIAVPFDVLADVEGRDDTPVTFEATSPDRTRVRWQDRGIPQAREHTVPSITGLRGYRKRSRAVAETLRRCASSAWPRSPRKPL